MLRSFYSLLDLVALSLGRKSGEECFPRLFFFHLEPIFDLYFWRDPTPQNKALSIQKKGSSKGSRHIKDHRLCLKLVCKTLWWMPPKKSWNSSIPVPCISAGFSPSSIHEIDYFLKVWNCVGEAFAPKFSAFSWNSDSQNLEKMGGNFTSKAWNYHRQSLVTGEFPKQKLYPFKESGFLRIWLPGTWKIIFTDGCITVGGLEIMRQKNCVSPCPSNEKDPSVLLSRSRMSLNMMSANQNPMVKPTAGSPEVISQETGETSTPGFV